MAGEISFHALERQGWSRESVALGYHKHLSEVTAQTIGLLLDAARVKAGTRVLDVACGAGYAAGAAAERGATGVDFSPIKVALAAKMHPALTFREADAAALPFDEGEYQAVVSNFGVPHFTDAVAFLREARRVLRPKGRVAFTAWADHGPKLSFGVIYAAVQKYGRPDVPLPAGPNFFLFGDAAHSERTLLEAGFDAVAVTPAPLTWRMTSPDDFLEAATKGGVRAAALLAAQSPEALAAIRDAMRERSPRPSATRAQW